MHTALAAAQWYENGAKAHIVRRIIVTGARTGGAEISEALIMAAIAASRGVPRHAILLEDKAQSTFQNARFSLPIAHSLLGVTSLHEATSRVTVVGRREHMSWAVPTFHAASSEFTMDQPIVATGVRADEADAQMAAFVRSAQCWHDLEAIDDARWVELRLQDARHGIRGID